MEIIWRFISWEGEWGKVTGNKKHKWWVQNKQGDAKNSIRNGVDKKLIRTTRGHELSGELLVGMGVLCGGG